MDHPDPHRHPLLPTLLLNLLFYTLTPFVTLFFLLVATPLILLHRLLFFSRRRTLFLLRRTISTYGACIIRCGWPFIRLRYIDLAPLEPPPFVLVANHVSFSDGFLMAFLPFEGVQVLNVWASRIPLLGIVSRLAGYLRIRDLSFDQFITAGSVLLSQGTSIVAFPEGTRSASRIVGPFHGAAFRLAIHNQVPIVPLVITGNQSIPRRGSLILHPGRITVAKLPAISPQQYAAMTPFKLKTLAHDIIQHHLDTHP